VGLKARIDWKVFHPELECAHDKDRKDQACAKPFDVLAMFKILVLEFLHNLPDDSIGYQVWDRFIFMGFLVLQIEKQVPGSKMVWTFRERLNPYLTPPFQI
jgi:hypothetical protein